MAAHAAQPDQQRHDLAEVVADLIADRGAQDPATLARRARRRLGDVRITPEQVRLVSTLATTLVPLPDGRIDHLARVLDGLVLTQRVRGSLRGRNDLWLGRGNHAFLVLAAARPLPLARGGEARLGETGEPVLVGPPGWLPEAGRGDLVGLRWREGRLSVSLVDPAHLARQRDELHVRTLMGERLSAEPWVGPDDPDGSAALAVRCLALARLEDPDLLTTPHAPLEELLYDPFDERPADTWRLLAASRQMESVSFSVAEMPVALHRELSGRAEEYGMTFDQFVIALLGHLAWRTPFAEDMQPWEPSVPTRSRPHLTVLPGGARGDASPAPGPPEAG